MSSDKLELFYKQYKDAINHQRNGVDALRKPALERVQKVFASIQSLENPDTILDGLLESPNCRADLKYISDTMGAYALTRFKLLSKEEMASEFQILNQKYGFEIDTCESKLRRFAFITRATITEVDPSTRTRLSVDLGKFKIDLSSRGTGFVGGVDYYVTAHPVGDNKPKQLPNGTCYHPHISSDSRLCLGTYNLTADASRGDILSVFYNLCNLVNRYNPNSLNFSGGYISNWVGHKCVVCSGFANDLAVKTHNGLYAHKDCCIKHSDDKYYTLNEVKECSKCGVTTPDFTAVSRTECVCNPCLSKKDA